MDLHVARQKKAGLHLWEVGQRRMVINGKSNAYRRPRNWFQALQGIDLTPDGSAIILISMKSVSCDRARVGHRAGYRSTRKGKKMFNLKPTQTRIASAIMVAAALTSVNAATAATVELATNGGFETGDFTGWTQFESAPGNQTISADNPSSGSFSGNINNGVDFSNSLMKQANVGIGIVTPGQSVDISFDARGSYAVPGGVAFAEFFSEVDGGGTSSALILGSGPLSLDPDPNVWKTFNFTTITGPDVSGGVTLQLGATNGPGNPTNMFYDNVSITVESTGIPEPGSAALLCLGAVGVVLRRRR